MKVQSIPDAYYTKLPSGVATQGDIWSNLPAAFRGASTDRGVVITPRCDLAHDKTQFINYLPIISLKEYLSTQGGFELLQHELQNASNTMDQASRDLGIHGLLVAGVPLNDALAVAEKGMDPCNWGAKRTQRRIADLQDHAAKVEMLSEILRNSRVNLNELDQLVNQKALSHFKKQIGRNTVSDLHFLPPCPPFFDEPAVVLLRCIGTARKELFSAALHCVTPHDWERALTANAAILPYNVREKPERMARLRSPYLEALMARFAALFSRVGTRDFPDEALNQMIDGG